MRYRKVEPDFDEVGNEQKWRDYTMIEARRNLVKEMKNAGEKEEEIYKSCIELKYKSFITEICNAEKAIENYVRYYYSRESDCPDSFKFLMLINKWSSPFIAINELLKRIDTNETLLKRECKKTGRKADYKSRYKYLRSLVQKEVNKHGQR